MSFKISENKLTGYEVNGKSLSFDRPKVMAIINLTPDSFYDGGKYVTLYDILKDVEEKISQGASILDLGAMSTRPGAQVITQGAEWKRLENPLREIRRLFPDIFISVDTVHSATALSAAGLGADIINDVSGGSMDPEMFQAVAKSGLIYVLTHMKGTPGTMQVNPVYGDVVYEVMQELERKSKMLKDLVCRKIILDPGFGFGKTPEHNFQLLKQLNQISSLGFPVMAGLSRKSMINKVLGTNPVTSLNGTSVLHALALLNGASVIRVHDVAEAVQAVELLEFYKSV